MVVGFRADKFFGRSEFCSALRCGSDFRLFFFNPNPIPNSSLLLLLIVSVCFVFIVIIVYWLWVGDGIVRVCNFLRGDDVYLVFVFSVWING